jgi:hypothetical protein
VEGGQADTVLSDRNSRGDMPQVARNRREKCDESSRPQRAAILLMGSPALRGSSSSRLQWSKRRRRIQPVTVLPSASKSFCR